MEGVAGAPELLLVKAIHAEMVGFAGRRLGWFLDPGGAPFVPAHHKDPSFIPLEVAAVEFGGWASLPRKWADWVEKLRPVYGESWKKAGIFDAIIASKYRTRKDPAAILGLARFWCEETSTFIFPWGEATVTLEDVAVLGGLPAVGDPVRGALHGELRELESMMNVERRRFNKSKCKKASHYVWLSHFIEGGSDEVEHVAFLTLWLSASVLPSYPFSTVSPNMIPLAIRIARGARIALAPAVLATLYRDLRTLKNHLVDTRHKEGSPLVVSAPFHLLQLWVWEHFAALRPKGNIEVDHGDSRIARWHDKRIKTEASFVDSILKSHIEFQWRPYGTTLHDKPAFCKGNGQRLFKVEASDVEMRSFAQFLKVSELVGLDCIEQYLPHRVAMQFGLDQDVPGCVARVNSAWKSAWKTYDISKKNIAMCVPPELFQSDVTSQYSVWWKQCMLGCRSHAVKRTEVHKSSSKKVKRSNDKAQEKKKTPEIPIFPSTKKRLLEELDDNITISDLLALKKRRACEKYENIQCHRSLPRTNEVQKQSSQKQKPKGMLKQSKKHAKKVKLDLDKLLRSPREQAREVKQNSDTCEQNEAKKSKQTEEDVSTDQLDEEMEKMVGVEGRNLGESIPDKLIEETEETILVEDAECQIELTTEELSMRAEDLKLEVHNENDENNQDEFASPKSDNVEFQVHNERTEDNECDVIGEGTEAEHARTNQLVELYKEVETTMEQVATEAAGSEIRSSKNNNGCDKEAIAEQGEFSSMKEELEFQVHNENDEENLDQVINRSLEIVHTNTTQVTESKKSKDIIIEHTNTTQITIFNEHRTESVKEIITGQEELLPIVEELEFHVHSDAKEGEIVNEDTELGHARTTVEHVEREASNNLDKEHDVIVEYDGRDDAGQLQVMASKCENAGNNCDEEILEDHNRKDAKLYASNYTLNAEPVATLQPGQTVSKMNSTEEKTSPQTDEEQDMEIRKLKEEIAVIEARVKCLEALIEVQSR